MHFFSFLHFKGYEIFPDSGDFTFCSFFLWKRFRLVLDNLTWGYESSLSLCAAEVLHFRRTQWHGNDKAFRCGSLPGGDLPVWGAGVPPSGLSGQTWSPLVPSSVPCSSSSHALPPKVQPGPLFSCRDFPPLSPSFECQLSVSASQMETPSPEVPWPLTSTITLGWPPGCWLA